MGRKVSGNDAIAARLKEVEGRNQPLREATTDAAKTASAKGRPHSWMAGPPKLAFAAVANNPPRTRLPAVPDEP